MYVIRSYKEIGSNKYVGAKIVDENNMQFIEKSWDELKNIVKNNKDAIKNLEIDNYGKLKLVNMNPKHKIKYYNRVYKDGFIVDQYCIITGYSCGKVSYIADSVDGIIGDSNVAISDIANTLKIFDIDHLNMYNAFTLRENNKLQVYIYHNNNYTKLQSIVNNNEIIDDIKREWDIEINKITQEGIDLNFIEHREGVKVATIPNCISHIEEFGGFVNDLTIPISVKTLGIECFTHSEYLRSVVIGEGIKRIPNRCFYNSSINSIKFSCNEEAIGESAFENSLVDGKIMTGAYLIENKAFCGTSIQSAYLIRAIDIGIGAFEYCGNLKEVSIRGDLKIIRHNAFKSCPRLHKVIIPKTTEIIQSYAFEGCMALKSIKIPVTTTIHDKALPKWCKVERY